MRLEELDPPPPAQACARSSACGVAPEQVMSRLMVGETGNATDIYLFGEAGLFGARRIADDGSPA